MDQEGRADGRPLRVQQPVGDPVDGEAHVLLRHDAPRHAHPRRRGSCRPSTTSRSPTCRSRSSATPGCSTSTPSARPSATRCSPSRTTAAAGPASAASTTAAPSTTPTTTAARTCCTCNELSSRTTCSSAASASGRRPASSATTRRRRCTTATRSTTVASPRTSARRSIDTTLTINSFFGWEFNSCEALRQDDTWHPIDFANACPDSQVTSLHYHFPWLVAANLRWSIFCAATKRPMPVNLDWAPYFEIADTDAPYPEKLRAYADDRPAALPDRRVRVVLRHPPRPPRPGRVGLLRLRHRPRRRPPEGRRAVPAPRGRPVHGPVLGAHPALARRAVPAAAPAG